MCKGHNVSKVLKFIKQEVSRDLVIARKNIVSMWHELKRDWVRFEVWLDKLANKWF